MKRFIKWFDPTFLHLRFEVLLLPHIRCQPKPGLSPKAVPAFMHASLNLAPAALLFFAWFISAQGLFQVGGWQRATGTVLFVALAFAALYLNYVFHTRGKSFLRIWKSGTDAERLALLERRRSELEQMNG